MVLTASAAHIAAHDVVNAALRHLDTSFRHLKDKGIEKFRLVFPLTTPIPAAGEFTDCDDLIDGSAWYELTEARKQFAGACDPASFRCNQF
jgi:hypothetical protein